MATMQYAKNEKILLRTIIAVSVAVPLVVAVLLFSPFKVNASMEWVKHLPAFHAFVNSATAILLLLGLYFIKKNEINKHKVAMLTAMAFGALFLVSYVVYHGSVESTKFGDINGDGLVSEAEALTAGGSRTLYLTVLLTHIVTAAVVLPMVLMSAYYAITNKIVQHRKLVKWAFPFWFYVSVTGVVVYYLIKPYYQF